MSNKSIASEIRKTHLKTGSWQKTADILNQRYGVHLSKAKYDDWLIKGAEPADEKIRQAFGLHPRRCPACHRSILQVARNRRYNQALEPHQKWFRGLNKSIRDQIVKDAYEEAKSKNA